MDRDALKAKQKVAKERKRERQTSVNRWRRGNLCCCERNQL